MKSSKIKVLIAAFLIALIAGASCFLVRKTGTPAPLPERPGNWAVPVDINGVPNYYKVTEDLYRGGQPTAEGVKHLKKMGIKTIINLRSMHSDKDEIGRTDIGYEHIKFEPWNVENEQIKRFLKIVTDETRTPVFVHCKYGSDRTGFMCAVYRIAVCGWGKQAAIDEMVNGGFGFHPVWKNIIKSLEKLDIEQIKEHAIDSPLRIEGNGF